MSKIRSKSSGNEKVLHRNLLFKIEGTEEDYNEELIVEEKKITGKKSEEELGNVEKSHDVMHEVSDSDEEENVMGTFHRGDAYVFVKAPDFQRIEAKEILKEIPTKEPKENEGRKNELPVEESVEPVQEQSLVVECGDKEFHKTAELHNQQTNIIETIFQTIEPNKTTEQNENFLDESTNNTVNDFSNNLPVPAPKRSTRQKKPPDRYGDGVAHWISPRPIDNKVKTLNELLKSGVLSNMDSESAHEIIKAIMN